LHGKKGITDGGNPREIFWNKMDKWSFFAFGPHLLSIAACALDIIRGRHITEDVPPILYVLSAVTVYHSLLLIRYLIGTVFSRSVVKIVQFLATAVRGVFLWTLESIFCNGFGNGNFLVLFNAW
jgi:hypothetical protein